ncbi:TetR/AcrR family transcriptional regulator [Bacillaceae bacterium CLA-AA-H227]|uniref:TetR/AcrR family transcriptional regulator n=1 Tax=Robertmurraya yapensis (ex Hitch et al 2024) TaxID=3133160 RepID=A0ACC6SCS0_9BACI
MKQNARLYIIEAFLLLLQTVDYKKITVTMIVKKAGVNRKTFYDYFENRENLLDQVEKEILNEFILTLGESTVEKINEARRLIESGQPLSQTIAVCHHIQSYQYFYKVRLNEGEFIHRFTDLIYTYLYRFSGNAATSTYISYGTIGYIKKWIDAECKEPIESIAYGMASATFKSLTESKLSTGGF